MSVALCEALPSQTFPRPKLGLTVTFLATEEHGSRASPELKSDRRRELQAHHDLQREGCGARAEKTGSPGATWLGAGFLQELRVYSADPNHTHFMGFLDLTVLSAEGDSVGERRGSDHLILAT